MNARSSQRFKDGSIRLSIPYNQISVKIDTLVVAKILLCVFLGVYFVIQRALQPRRLAAGCKSNVRFPFLGLSMDDRKLPSNRSDMKVLNYLSIQHEILGCIYSKVYLKNRYNHPHLRILKGF